MRVHAFKEELYKKMIQRGCFKYGFKSENTCEIFMVFVERNINSEERTATLSLKANAKVWVISDGLCYIHVCQTKEGYIYLLLLI